MYHIGVVAICEYMCTISVLLPFVSPRHCAIYGSFCRIQDHTSKWAEIQWYMYPHNSVFGSGYVYATEVCCTVSDAEPYL